MRLALALALLAAPGAALADDFFKLSPGPLTEAHAELDNTDNCTKCHELGKGVTNFLCLDCHQHQPLRDAIKEKRGLHASFKKDCRSCHAEHKGREAFIVDWGPVGGRQSFRHTQTGFDLAGQHEKVACTACHKRKLKSGRTSFIDVPPDCDACHKNPHAFTSKELREACTKCHLPGVVRKLKSADLFFDHKERAGLALVGKHGEVDCVRCHEGAKMSKPASGGRVCSSCHAKDSPHGRAFAKSDCKKCHGVDGPWKKSSFDHDTTGFSLKGEHDTNRCGQCHKSADEKPSPQCRSCHGDPHGKRFDPRECKLCHGLGGTKKVLFAHDRETEFTLTGKHASASCRSCHRGKTPKAFERFETGDCMSCHRHANAHNGEFKDKGCLDCHVEGGKKKVKFDHLVDARFKTTGFHGELEKAGKCKKCHPDTQYRTGKLACADCHEDSHKGELGKDCADCHSDAVHFKETVFDHDRARFALTHAHKKVECAKCHPNRRYKTGQIACFDCHQDDEPHELELGKSCEKCHLPTKGAPKFEHDAMTAFARTGKHTDAPCQLCHRPSFPGGAPPPVGWAKELALDKLDLRFPTPGRDCASCHHDPHDGAYGVACDSCHTTNDFREASRAVHDTGAFRLAGTHDLLPCARCHEKNRALQGLGSFCGACHRADDAHQHALGERCGDCHSQLAWRPARFDHATTGYALRGAHRSARCEDCHGVGRYAGTPTDCAACHGIDAARVVDPPHEPAAFADCKGCHSEIAFAPARRNHPWFPLTGAHAANRCIACHLGGRYAGTPDRCLDCHRAAYLDPSNQPNHLLVGYGELCEDCHSTSAWTPARRP